jgi:hypothetical protein
MGAISDALPGIGLSVLVSLLPVIYRKFKGRQAVEESAT